MLREQKVREPSEHQLIRCTQGCRALHELDLCSERVREPLQVAYESVARVHHGLWGRDFPSGLHLDLDVLLERVRFLVASEADALIEEELMPDGVPERVVLVAHSHRALVPLPRVLLVRVPTF
jgi:hypothetical protein